MPPAFFGQGALWQVETSAGNYDTIPKVGSISGPGQSRDTVEVTNHSSPAGYREYIGGLRDGDEISADVYWTYDSDVYDFLEDAFRTQDDNISFQVVYPMTPLNETYTFDGWVTGLADAAPVDGALTKALKVKITGPIEHTNDDS